MSTVDLIHQSKVLPYKINGNKILVDNNDPANISSNYKVGGSDLKAGMYMGKREQTPSDFGDYYKYTSPAYVGTMAAHGTTTMGGETPDFLILEPGIYILKRESNILKILNEKQTETLLRVSYNLNLDDNIPIKVWIWLVGGGGNGAVAKSNIGGGGGGGGAACVFPFTVTNFAEITINIGERGKNTYISSRGIVWCNCVGGKNGNGSVGGEGGKVFITGLNITHDSPGGNGGQGNYGKNGGDGSACRPLSYISNDYDYFSISKSGGKGREYNDHIFATGGGGGAAGFYNAGPGTDISALYGYGGRGGSYNNISGETESPMLGGGGAFAIWCL